MQRDKGELVAWHSVIKGIACSVIKGIALKGERGSLLLPATASQGGITQSVTPCYCLPLPHRTATGGTSISGSGASSVGNRPSLSITYTTDLVPSTCAP